MKNMIIAHNGSVQNIPTIPDDVKAIYKTVWEISQKKIIDLAADRGAFICQSQSLNVHLQAPSTGQLTSMHFYGWKKGLKTGMYYLRTRPAAQAIKFTVDPSVLKDAKKQVVAGDARRAGAPTPAAASRTNGSAVPVAIPPAPASLPPVTPSAAPTQATSATPAVSDTPLYTPIEITDDLVDSIPLDALSLDNKTLQAAQANPEYATALKKKYLRELEDAKLQCSIENKEACVMCSG